VKDVCSLQLCASAGSIRGVMYRVNKSERKREREKERSLRQKKERECVCACVRVREIEREVYILSSYVPVQGRAPGGAGKTGVPVTADRDNIELTQDCLVVVPS